MEEDKKRFYILIHLNHPCYQIHVIRDKMTQADVQELEDKQGYVELNKLRKQLGKTTWNYHE
jgi:hypothetical protein